VKCSKGSICYSSWT